MTWLSLTDDLRRYMERGGTLDKDVEVEIPRVINRAELDLADRFDILGYMAPYNSKMKRQEPRIAKPQNWRKTVSINFGTGDSGEKTKVLRLRSYEFIRTVYNDRTQLGEPEYYADYDYKHWLVGPAPNIAFPFEAVVWRLPPLLSQANQTNWLTENQPNLLLYTALQGLEAFLKNVERASMWKAFADERFGLVTNTDKKRMSDRAQQRSSP